MYLHFGHIFSEMGKENKLAYRNLLFIYQKKTKKEMK